MGNSQERVRLDDLHDVIYYRQNKDYTDQEFEGSRDLQREIGKGRLTVLNRYDNPRSTSEGQRPDPVMVKVSAPNLSREDIKQAVVEVLGSIPKPQAAPAAPTVDDVRKVILEVMTDYKKDNQVTVQDVKTVISEVLGDKAAQVQSIDPAEIKGMIADLMKNTAAGFTAKDLQDMIPLIADAVRQEVARIQIISSHGVPQTDKPVFMGPEYIPTVSTEGMVSNVKGEERISSGGSMSDNLEALKRLQSNLNNG